tara:strand:+ start:128 stop:334 length:207 start_codon:yes stop_codon:yes gene_type:complete
MENKTINSSLPSKGPKHPPFTHRTKKDRKETNIEWIEYTNIELRGIQRPSAKTTRTGRRRKIVKMNSI